MNLDEQALLEARRWALAHPLDGQTPPDRALVLELPLNRTAFVVLSTERRSGDSAPWWNVAVSVRGEIRPDLHLDCEEAARVACERAIDGVGQSLAAWSWDTKTLIGRLRSRMTDQEARSMAPSLELPYESAKERWYLRPIPVAL